MVMTRDEVKRLIVGAVERLQGCKATELACQAELASVHRDGHNVIDIIDELVNNGELVEVVYILPTMNYRAKSFLLPKGTKVNH